MSTQIKLTGGRIGYQNAVDAAFASNMHSPAVKYSNSRGFRVESELTPSDSDVIWKYGANYSANTGDRLTPSYAEARRQIIAAMDDE